MKDNKKWYDMLCNWNERVSSVPNTKERIEYCMEQCRVSLNDLAKYNPNKEYRSMFLSLYFLMELYTADHDKEYISTKDTEYSKLHSCFVNILLENGYAEIAEERSKCKSEQYANIRSKYNIQYPRFVNWDNGFYMAKE